MWIKNLDKPAHLGRKTTTAFELHNHLAYQMIYDNNSVHLHRHQRQNQQILMKYCVAWQHLSHLWRHQMETFFAPMSLFAGNPPVIGGFPSERDNNADLWSFFVVSLNKLLNKHRIDR